MTEDLLDNLPFGLSDLPSEPLGDLAHSYSPDELATFKHRRVASGSDVVDRPDSAPVVPRPWLASAAVGLVPGSGFADAFGVLPDFEKGGYHPSLGANLWRGDIGAAGWQALGVLGDLTYLGSPVLGVTAGTALKSGRATQLAQRAATNDLFDFSNPIRRGDVPQSDVIRYDPPRGVRERMSRLIGNSRVEKEMKEIIEAAKHLGANWYNTEPLRQAFMKELGAAEGEAAYTKFLSYVAAASPVSDVGETIRNASYYFGRVRRGEGLPVVGDSNRYPYGHRVQKLHQRLAQLVEGPGLDPIRHAKILSFFENLRGNHAPVTLDTHAFRLPAMIARDPSFLKQRYQRLVRAGKLTIEEALENPSYWGRVGRNEYAALERFYKRLAEETGLTPAQAQAAAWVGGAHRTGLKSKNLKSFMEFFQDRIERTAREKGLSPEQILRDFIHGRMDLVSIDGLTNPVA